jgi:hypothetical protein
VVDSGKLLRALYGIWNKPITDQLGSAKAGGANNRLDFFSGLSPTTTGRMPRCSSRTDQGPSSTAFQSLFHEREGLSMLKSL